MLVTKQQLQKIFPRCRFPETWERPLNQAMQRFEIDTPNRIAAFLGQVGYESNQLNSSEEDLYYSPRRITEVWPSRFRKPEDAIPFARNPEKLGNCVYADRLGNGDEASCDGYRYRGRGLIQVTGKSNYDRIGEILEMPSLVQMPDYLAEPKYAALSAAAFWHMRKLNKAADELTEENMERGVEFITKKVSGSKRTSDRRLDLTLAALELYDTSLVA